MEIELLDTKYWHLTGWLWLAGSSMKYKMSEILHMRPSSQVEILKIHEEEIEEECQHYVSIEFLPAHHSVDNYELWVPLCGVVVLTAETCLATDIAIIKLKLVTSL